jgi:esterase/lipase superfamily enzyme
MVARLCQAPIALRYQTELAPICFIDFIGMPGYSESHGICWAPFRPMRTLRSVFGTAAVLGLVVLSVSCRTLSPRMTDAVVVPVYYATDRQPLMPLEVWQAKLRKKGSDFPYYGYDYNPAPPEMGICEISLPIGRHRTGVVERPSWYESAEHADKCFTITSLQPLKRDLFFAELNRRLTNSTCREIAVFIHGYNVTFSTAALYTCQLSWDWDFRGVPILYSWPSHGTLLAYPRDEESAHLTEAHLRSFLEDLLTKTAATRVHLIAHSLGCRALTDVLTTFVNEPNQPLFGEVVLAAPDVNRVEFMQDVAESLPRVARRVTIYASSTDKAMMASRSLHQYERAGDAGRGLAVCKGIDTIDTSDVDTDLLGHSYLVRSQAVIADIADVICRGLPPEQRNLTPERRDGLVYWRLKN